MFFGEAASLLFDLPRAPRSPYALRLPASRRLTYAESWAFACISVEHKEDYGMMVRAATMADVPALKALIDLSVRGLSAGHYTRAQVDAALEEVFGVDTQLIADGTYYIVDESSGPAAA